MNFLGTGDEEDLEWADSKVMQVIAVCAVDCKDRNRENDLKIVCEIKFMLTAQEHPFTYENRKFRAHPHKNSH